MKRESRAGVVGVRVGPRMGHRGIVDREYLKELLPCSHCPVDHLHKVEEIAHTEILLCAHGECRYGHTGATPCRTGVDHTLSEHHQGIMLVGGHNVHHSVVATLPGLQFMSGAVENHKLVSERQRHLTQVDACRPAGKSWSFITRAPAGFQAPSVSSSPHMATTSSEATIGASTSIVTVPPVTGNSRSRLSRRFMHSVNTEE